MTALSPLSQAFQNPESGHRYRKEFHHLAEECEHGNAVLPLAIVTQKYHDLYVAAMGGHPLSQNVDIHLVGNTEGITSHVWFRIFAAQDGIWVTAQCPVDVNGMESIPSHLAEYKAPKATRGRR